MSYSRAATDDYFVTSPQSYNSASYTPVTEYSPHYDYNVNNQWRPPPDSRHNSETFINPANGYQSTGSFEADPDNLPDPSTLQHRFRRRDQILKQLRVVLGRFILSFAICAAIVIVLLYYQNMKEMKTSNKHFFNAIHTGLLLILGLNIVSAFKEMADIFRWKLLASRRNKSEGDTMGLRGAGGRDISAGFSAQEVDLILGISSYQKCCRLMWHWLRKRPMLFFPLTAWVLFGIVSPKLCEQTDYRVRAN